MKIFLALISIVWIWGECSLFASSNSDIEEIYEDDGVSAVELRSKSCSETYLKILEEPLMTRELKALKKFDLNFDKGLLMLLMPIPLVISVQALLDSYFNSNSSEHAEVSLSFSEIMVLIGIDSVYSAAYYQFIKSLNVPIDIGMYLPKALRKKIY